MKQTKTIIIPAVPEKTKDVVVYVCDFCDREAPEAGTGYAYKMGVCSLCSRHVCKGLQKGCLHYDPYDASDYPSSYCPLCYDLLFTKYKATFDTLEVEYEAAKETLLTKICAESLLRVPKQKQ